MWEAGFGEAVQAARAFSPLFFFCERSVEVGVATTVRLPWSIDGPVISAVQ